MRKITQEELESILDKHKKWLRDDDGERADLGYINLRYADLSYADLRSADLRDTNLSYANLSYADLKCADLKCADLSHADLRGADFRYAKGIKVISTIFDTSRTNNQLNYIIDFDIATTGCFQGTLQELKEKVSETHKDNDVIRKRYERAIKFIEEMVEDYKENEK